MLSFHEPVGRLVSLRWSILPPYCSNLDEDQKTPEDYADYFAANGRDGIAATDTYIEKLSSLAATPESDTAFQEVLDARTEFVRLFPFCADELTTQISLPTREIMHRAYLRDVTGGRLLELMREYRDIVQRILAQS
jgi:hypothetical protein